MANHDDDDDHDHDVVEDSKLAAAADDDESQVQTDAKNNEEDDNASPIEEENSKDVNNQENGDDESGDNSDGSDSDTSQDDHDDDDDDSSSEDDEEQNESSPNSGETAAAPVVTDEYGNPLSAYEIQRLERIRRNREYLASLGLEKDKPSHTMKQASAAKKKKKVAHKKKKPDLKRRSSISRASKAKPIDYSEHKPHREQKDATTGDGTTKDASKSEAAGPSKRPKENRAARMERFIYDEFKRIGSDQKWTLKRAQKFVRAADVEYRIAKQRAERYEKKRRKEEETQQILLKMERERRLLGGYTAKGMLHEVDSRMFEIFTAIRTFDERFNKQADMIKWAENQEEARRKMEIIDAMDRFPRALKDSVRDLDMLLLDRSPKDPPPPRRGTRKRKTLDDSGNAKEPEPDKKLRAVESPDGTKEKLSCGGWGGLASAISAETLSSSTRESLEKPSPIDGVEDSADAKCEHENKPKKKKRELIARNVGGWVSPAFSRDIDRSWLEHDGTPKKFDLATYIPQVGDTVLYYPAGHRKFLKLHPDFVGKKTRNITRMTLWDRAKKEKAKLEKVTDEEKEDNEEGNKASSKWWNDEWLSSIDGDLDRYPIVCRVEKTHAEFPPDPYAENKVVTKDEGSGGVQVSWTVKIDNHGKKRTHPPLCLAVMLHPLTTVLPPNQEAIGDHQLSHPPNFYVVTFPSKASPFVVPFSWAYRLSHSFSVGSPVRLSSKPESRGKVKRFRPLGGDDSATSSRLDDKMESVRHVLSSLKSEQKTFASSLEEAISSDSHASLPIADACAVIERFESAAKANGNGSELSSQSATDDATGMMQLVRSTLPLWKEVVIESGTGRKHAMSAWELSSTETKNFVLSGPLRSISDDIEVETGLVYSIDHPLRAKIECTIEDFLKDTADAAMFCPLVTDEDAPSYSCAVPRGMAFNKILRRLKVLNKSGTARCYYRSIDSLLGDISAIVENCVLYNSPDSVVVEKAESTVTSIRRLITQVASRHFKEKEAREKLAEERRQAILMQFNAPAMMNDENHPSGSAPRDRARGKREVLVPYNGFLHRSWIQDTERDGSWSSSHGSQPVTSNCTQSAQAEGIGNGKWVPQSGDMVLYSRSRHSDFVKRHHPSLTTDQCALPRFVGESTARSYDTCTPAALTDNIQNRWLVGKVVWVRASFPRQPTKRDSDYQNTFKVASPVLSVGIKFNYAEFSKKIYEVSWRPYAFSPESSKTDLSTRSAIARDAREEVQGSNEDGIEADVARESSELATCVVQESFLRPAWISLNNRITEGDIGDSSSLYLPPKVSEPRDLLFAHPSGLSEQQINSIDRCLNVLKRRCLDELPANYIDPKFTTENVKKGWCPPSAKAGRSLPTFDRLLVKGNTSVNDASTRGVEKVDQRAIALLAEANYLPRWTSALSGGTNEKTNHDGIAQSLALHETLSPCPNLCLELAQTRLRNGYYRSQDGLVHDIEEAYVSSILLLLAKPSLAKQGQAISIRRIAKALSSREVISSIHAVKKTSKKTPSASSSIPDEKKATKNSSLSDNEQSFVEKIDRIRKLYGMALACVTETNCMERILGTIPRKKVTSKAQEVRLVDDAELAIREARQKLGFVYHALQRDMCNNRPSTATPTPSFKVRIRFTGQESQSMSKEVEGSNENGVTGSAVVEMDAKGPISIEPVDYENNQTLVSFFFGKPGRVASCGRCSAYGRSTLTCRVRKNHSQPDFDWAAIFQGTGGVSGLLHMLRTGQRPVEATLPANEVNQSQSPPLQHDHGTSADASNDTSESDPLLLLEKAREAVFLSQKVLEQAERKSRSQPRLSDEFIRTYFPIDPADGHYNYCILCGLIGDIICCEGCPNVVHPHCVKLDEIPDEDWFCATCWQKKREDEKKEETMPDSSNKDARNGKEDEETSSDSHARDAREDKDESKVFATQSKASAGEYVVPPSQSEWDGLDKDADRLEIMVAELKALRPIRPKKPKKVNASKRKDGDGDDLDHRAGSPVIDDDGDGERDQRVGNDPISLVADDGGGSSSEDSDEDQTVKPAAKRIRIRVGMKIRKKFGNHGEFIGTVLELPSSENPFYLVRYEDDDEEDMEEDEVRKYLITEGTKRSATNGSKARSRQSTGSSVSNEERQVPVEAAVVGNKRSGRLHRATSPATSEGTAATEAGGGKRRGRSNQVSATIEPTVMGPGERKRRGHSTRKAQASHEYEAMEPTLSGVEETNGIDKKQRGKPGKRGRQTNESSQLKKRGRPRKKASI